MVRCFEHGDIVHVAGKVDPISDIETIDTELALADLDSVEKALNRAERAAKGGDKDAAAQAGAGQAAGGTVRRQGWSFGRPDDEEKALVRDLFLLTLKPVMYIANVLEDGSRTTRTWKLCARMLPQKRRWCRCRPRSRKSCHSSTMKTAIPSWPTWA